MGFDGFDRWCLGATASCFIGRVVFMAAAALGQAWAPLALIGGPIIGWPLALVWAELWFRKEASRHG